MPRLVEFQRSFATDVLFGASASANYLRAGSVTPAVAIQVHRDSVLAALVNAMRLSCPTLAAIVDESFFEQSVRDYARARPPHSACLGEFGDEFASFLDIYPPAKGFQFFGDIVRFDIAIDKTSHELAGSYGASFAFGAYGGFRLLTSLTQITTKYPVDLIRDEVEAGRFEGLERIDMKPGLYQYALWRNDAGASVKQLPPPAAAFLGVLLEGGDCNCAVKRALEHAGPDEVLRVIQGEILILPICSISSE